MNRLEPFHTSLSVLKHTVIHVMKRPAKKYPLMVPRFERNMDYKKYSNIQYCYGMVFFFVDWAKHT